MGEQCREVQTGGIHPQSATHGNNPQMGHG